jgi:acyl-coenzyme A thioesterase 9
MASGNPNHPHTHNVHRIGKVLEDLDALAAAIAFMHCDYCDGGLTLVTASVDTIHIDPTRRLITSSPPPNLRLRGMPTYAGFSSLEVQLDIDGQFQRSSKWEHLARAHFIMVGE